MRLSMKMWRALQASTGVVGLYHEFANTSTVNALVRRHLIRSEGLPGWYRATEKGRDLLKTTTANSVGTEAREAGRSAPSTPPVKTGEG